MDGLLDFFSREAGQRRTKALNEAIGYYIPPNLRPLMGLLAEATPTASYGRAAQAGEEMLAPGRTPMQRVGSAGEMLTGVAEIAAPAAVANRVAMPAAQAVQEGLLGFSMAADDVGRRVIERANQPGPVPTMYSNPIDFQKFRQQRAQDELVDKITGAIEDLRSGASQARKDAAAFELHKAGFLPLKEGTKVDPPSSWDMPGDWQISGYFVDPLNPNRFGYNLTSDAGDTYQAMVSDPPFGYKMDDPQRFGGGFRAYAGPQSERMSYAQREAQSSTPAPSPTEAEAAAINAEYEALFGPSLPTPRNEAEAMAKQVLEMRAAGQAGDVTEEMMAAADPQYMFANTPLPMDEASRMQRAREMGRRDEFHGTTTGSDMVAPDAFRGSGSRQGIGFVTSDNPYVASSYADPSFGSVFPMLNQPLPSNAPRIDASGNVWSDISVETPVKIGDQYIPARQLSVEPADVGGVLSTNQLSRGASFDHPGIEFANISDRSIHAPRPNTDDGMAIMREFQRLASEPSTVTMRQDTRGMRSRFARFDPEFRHLRNLSAGFGGLGLLATQQPQQERENEIRQYLGGLL